ncbi:MULTISPECIES: amino acid ABC transporter permease [Lysinibacillus]|uniref:Amino acid ABC transporter permease n=1 Tax=Lysinibacillus antri TaxID=2498145 RepID=A0A3S0RTJ0_9BACI|nr:MULTISPECIES: amino acid ABC transporter permease [Lysinibacillus]RUL47416.1 amino acid ABC transporter permease [Lysinibacillus antri]TSI06989.1 amino acid ABC transporter permease [Lysinibacillus sp. BW-2-10]
MDFFDLRWDIIWNYRELFLRGIWVTLVLTLSGYVGGIILGVLIGLGETSKRKLIYWPSKLYVDLFRGTPMLVQILIIHLALIPAVFGQSFGFMVSGITALILNSAAYNAEIIRAGIQSIDKGQMEAARSLGLTHNQAMRKIILPQAFRRMIPPLGNEFIALLKDSSLVTVIAASDILYAAKVVAGAYNRFWEPYLVAALLYLILTYLVTKVVAYIEKRFSNDYNPRKKREGRVEQ